MPVDRGLYTQFLAIVFAKFFCCMLQICTVYLRPQRVSWEARATQQSTCSLCILGLAPFSHTHTCIQSVHYRCQQYCCPGGKVHVLPVLFVNICEKSVIFVHQMIRRLRVMHFIALIPLHVMIAHTTRALAGVTNVEFSALHVHGTIQR